jgi:transposase InsO family protein
MSLPSKNKRRFLFKNIKGYHRFDTMTYKLEQYLNHPEVEDKIKILLFFDKYGLNPTKDAFLVSRSTIYLWRKKIKDGNGSLLGLINRSKRPYNTRRMLVDKDIFEFIKKFREDYPRLGKEKIKPLLDEYCRSNSKETISESKIGRIIKKNNWYFYLGKRSTKRQIIQDKRRVFGYEVNKPGDLFQVDTIVRFEHGIKRYIITAIDVVSKFTFAYCYKSHSSQKTADFVEKLIKVTPYPLMAIQTDNGSEFLLDFDKVIQKLGIVHFFTYPRCPKQNGCIERFNRSLQEEFVDFNAILLEEKETKEFNDRLIDYLLWYNTKRPHKSLGNIPPMQVVVDYLKKSNMYRTDTFYCLF